MIHQRKNEINAATLKKFGKLWCRNSIKNLAQYGKRGGVGSLENKAFDDEGKALPFLIIGAGPSLETKACFVVLRGTVLSSSADGYLGCFHLLAVENHAAMSIHTQAVAWTHVRSSWVHI